MNAPAFQFYPSDFIMGTASMTPDEVGGYIRLLCHQWTGGGVPNNRKKLESLTGISGESLDTILEKFRLYEDGKLKNDRLEKVRSGQQEYREKQSRIAKTGWEKRRVANANPMPTHMPDGCQNDGLQSSSSSSTLTTTTTTPSESSLGKEPNSTPPLENKNPVPLPSEERKKAAHTGAAPNLSKEHLFAVSPFADLEKFVAAFTDPKYHTVDLQYYYEAVRDWSAAGNKKRIDWIAVARTFIRGDAKENKIKQSGTGSKIQERVGTMQQVQQNRKYDKDGNRIAA